MNIEQLEVLRDAKKAEAAELLNAEAPDVEQAETLIGEAEGFQKRIDLMRKTMTPKPAPEAKPKATLTVVADEEDKKAAVTTYGLGEFCKMIADEDPAVRAYGSPDLAGFYDVNKAIGNKVVGNVKAITGMSESVPADGGFLVGTDANTTIMGRVYSSGELARRVSMYPISANSNGMTFLANAETSRVAGSRWGGVRYYWAAEGAEKTASAPTFRKIELSLNKLIGLVYATDELLQDASTLEAYIMDILPQELAVGFDNTIYNGTGAGQPLGILNAPCLVTQAAEAGQAAATIVSENVINMWSRRWVGSRDYVWMINQDVTPQLIQMNLGVGTGGALTYMPPGGLSGSMYGTLFGRPVIEIEQCPTLGTVGDIALCSWSEYIAIQKGGVQSASSIHVRFIFDESVFRFVLRVDGQPGWNSALTPMNSTVTQGPFVVLATRS
jgi:HK97 family phage major capsid protein